MKANTGLRETLERIKLDFQDKDGDCFELQIENNELRERVEILEGLMKQHSNVIEGSLSEQVRSKIGASISEFGNAGANSTVDDIYNELVNLR